MKKFQLLSAGLLLLVFAKGQTNFNFPVQTKIENGIIEGNYDKKAGIQEYFGIQFAKTPGGN